MQSVTDYHRGERGSGAPVRMGDPGGGGNGASPRSTYKFSNGFLFRTAADSISSISYFGDSLPYLFVK